MTSLYQLLAAAVVVLHLAFILFVVLGGLLVLRRPRWAWLHLPAAVWGTVVEGAGWICPLTPLEQELRRRAGLAPWEGDFVARYLFPMMYPEALTRPVQWLLAAVVVGINVLVYAALVRRWRVSRKERSSPPEAGG